MTISQHNNERLPQGIRLLKEEQNLYLYGADQYTKKVIDNLKAYHVIIKGILVSKGFKEQDFYDDFPVMEYSPSMSNVQYTLIAIFDILRHSEVTNRLLEDEKVKKIYALNGRSVLNRTGFEFPNPKIYLIDTYYNRIKQRGLDYKYYKDNEDLFTETFEWMSDGLSKEIMEAYLLGHIEIENYPMKKFWKKEDMDKQYFDKDIIKLSNHETVVDCGAYTGDTFESFCRKVKGFDKYYALEPDANVFLQLKGVIKKNGGNVVHIPYGAWKERGTLTFQVNESESSVIEDNSGKNISKNSECINIEVDSIDNIVSKEDKVSFVKMDIEGSELNALIGAKETIKKCKPKMAICVYHKREDLITIPQYIKSLVKDYRLYLRPYRPYLGEVVLYAIPD